MGKEGFLHIIVDAMPAVSCEINWVTVLSAMLTPVVAIVGVYIAYQQYRINEQRLRHETYERRLAVYKCVQIYIRELLVNGKITYERALKFYSDASETIFLFDESVQNRIDEIYEKSITLATAQEKLYPSNKLSGLPVGEEREKVCIEKEKLIVWFNEQLKENRVLFAQKIGLKVK